MLHKLHLILYFVFGFSVIMTWAYIYNNALERQALTCQEGC